jgi:hypothetical protein
MVRHFAIRFRALLGGRGLPASAEGYEGNQDEAEDDLGGLPGPDPEWDELLAWARESEDEPEWQELIERAKRAVPPAIVSMAPTVSRAARDDEEDEQDDAEWGRLLDLARARAVPLAVVPREPPGEPPRAPAGSITSLTARLERLAAQVPDARRRAR